MENSPSLSFCDFDGCTREALPYSRYCQFCQKKGALRDYQRQAVSHQEAVLARREGGEGVPAAWEVLLGYCQPSHEDKSRGATYTYAIGLHGYVKFGQSLSVEGRLMNLQIASPKRLRLLGKIISSRQLEYHLHGALHEHAVRGDWFRLNNTTRAIVRLMNANDMMGICKSISGLMTGKHAVSLVEATRNKVWLYASSSVIV